MVFGAHSLVSCSYKVVPLSVVSVLSVWGTVLEVLCQEHLVLLYIRATSLLFKTQYGIYCLFLKVLAPSSGLVLKCSLQLAPT